MSNEESLKNVIANYYASEVLKNRGEKTDDYLEEVFGLISDPVGKDTLAAIQKALEDKTGASLTKDEWVLLNDFITNGGEAILENAWNALPEF